MLNMLPPVKEQGDIRMCRLSTWALLLKPSVPVEELHCQGGRRASTWSPESTADSACRKAASRSYHQTQRTKGRDSDSLGFRLVQSADMAACAAPHRVWPSSHHFLSLLPAPPVCVKQAESRVSSCHDT